LGVDGMQLLTARNARGVSVTAQLDTEGAKRNLSVIARPNRFFHASLPLREQAGKQYAGFHLRARHRHFVLDSLQVPAPDVQRWAVVGRSGDLRAHRCERLHDARHGPSRKRFVAEQLTAEILSRHDAA